jgi:poly-beta-1,6-N-acetyl-D-glucosamine synthase
MTDFFAGSMPLFSFVFYYPLFMAYLWMIGALYYYLRREYNERLPDDPPPLANAPPVSIIIPCHNEAEQIEETISHLSLLEYPDFEIIAVNDGSTDGTGELLESLAARYDRLRVIHFAANQGKAMGLRMGALVAKHDFLICIDGDALLDRHAVSWMMSHFLSGPRVGAVTGNPRVRTRSTLLGKIQVGEFSAIVGMIKRAQRIYGRVFTISGVVCGFRRSALHHVGYWGLDMITEDIDISWRLQLNHWDIRFEPNALCWILMPETLKGLWRQRLRWAQGGSEVLLRYMGRLSTLRSRRMWPVFLEYCTSVIWSYSMLLVIVLFLLGLVVPLPEFLRVPELIPTWPGVILGMTCLLQFAVGMAMDSRYARGMGRYYYSMVWYPLVFWIINMLTTAVGFPRAILKKRGQRAVWAGSDRGIRSGEGA